MDYDCNWLEKLLNDSIKKLEKPTIGKTRYGIGIDGVFINKGKRVCTVIFSNGHKQVVRCNPKDDFDPEVGVSLAIARELLGSRSALRKLIDKRAKQIESKEKKAKVEKDNGTGKQE